MPALPLQLLLVRHPDWVGAPVVVVDRDKPTGVILWANRRARTNRILPGMRYAAGLALAKDLRAGTVNEEEIAKGVAFITDRLRRFSPEIEPAQDEPGVFWVNASGLGLLYESLEAWARWIVEDLAKCSFISTVAVGFTRFGTYAIAKAGFHPRPPPAKAERKVIVFREASEEDGATRKVPLEMLGINPNLRDTLEKLGVRTVGQFLRLPARGIRRRFGPAAHQFHQFATGGLWRPLAPSPETIPLAQNQNLDHAERNVQRLLFLVKRLLEPLLTACAARQEALTELTITMKLEASGRGGRSGTRVEKIRTAAPTLDGRQILNLVHLRLDSIQFPSGVEEIELRVAAERATAEQLRLFVQQPKRNLRAAEEAFARIRAEFGDRAIVSARLKDGHLPEARFSWEPVYKAARPSPDAVELRPLVRRIYTRSIRLPPRPRHEPDGWLLRGMEHGHVVNYIGPYVVSGGWWRTPVHREYHFAQMKNGEFFWIYYDRRRRRWYLQGEVL